MLICKYFINFWVLLVDRKEESLQKGVIIVILFVIDLFYIDMHAIQYHFKKDLDKCMLF